MMFNNTLRELCNALSAVKIIHLKRNCAEQSHTYKTFQKFYKDIIERVKKLAYTNYIGNSGNVKVLEDF